MWLEKVRGTLWPNSFCDHYLEIGILSGGKNQLFIVINIRYSSELFGIKACDVMDDYLMVSCAAFLISGLEASFLFWGLFFTTLVLHREE